MFNNGLEKVKEYLSKIKGIPGVENVVLSQRDGFPIESAGVWLTRKEILGVCSSTSAIYNAAEELHGNLLNRILIDGTRAKILVAPLQNSNLATANEYFIAITTKPKTNVGKIFLGLKETLTLIRRVLDDSNAEFIPPLITFSADELEEIHKSFLIKEGEDQVGEIETFSMKISYDLRAKVNKLVAEFTATISGVKLASVVLNGGYLLCNQFLEIMPKAEGPISYTLFDTSKRIIYRLKKTPIECVTIECSNYIHFLYKLNRGIFSAFIQKDGRLGLLRIVIPSFVKRLNVFLAQMQALDDDETELKRILHEFDLLDVSSTPVKMRD